MIKIVLFCAAENTARLLVQKMEQEAEARDLEIYIKIFLERQIDEQFDEIDLILITPEVAYILPMVKEIYEPEGIQVDVISAVDFSIVNGEKVLNFALDLLEEKEVYC
ncbi:PTS sugar transporter subunit IIB [Clostridium fungisolvens]|uniref:PTS system cellobiose-specific EIIB component n=1 Tax=Clostridium fungisolvens TaxID=1604897 RepID=A0A6V8SIB1_9CLOT|nr:PTS sugar transporter subunit IIB [Clostridium fungisolvens]GFP76476.1 PTS system cellobiose-specific EIIB component [Clostridium fungisolvens]